MTDFNTMGFAKFGVVLFMLGHSLDSVAAEAEVCDRTLRSIAFFYRAEMVPSYRDGASPSPQKPQKLLSALQERGEPIAVKSFEPLERDDFKLAHNPSFVDDVFDLRRQNGFGTVSRSLVDSLPYTSGSLYHAARWAIQNGIAWSPTSGFHHAGYDYCGGFCTFNGLMISALKLQAFGLVERVAIIDADYHYGNGTADILSKELSSQNSIYHFSFGEKYWSGDLTASKQKRLVRDYLSEFERIAEKLSEFSPQLIIYQAGADTHIRDPLGGILTTEEMFERDRRMFSIAKGLKIPIVWNLAGGYQKTQRGDISAVIDLHLQTFNIAKDLYLPKPTL